MNTIKLYPAPKPQVQHLKTFISQIAEGKLRTPAFQRAFVWGENQVLELLESIVRGYPIGSLLFWSVDQKILEVQTEPINPFPAVPVKYPLEYVLDGLQRLSTLYGIFNAQKNNVNKFNVVYDLRKGEFSHYESGTDLSGFIHMADLFSPKELLATQSRLAKLPDGDTLIEKSLQLLSVFQDYMIPAVTISEREVKDVAAIFHRINSTGTRLSSVDFMRALTWSPDFDLNKEIDNLQKDLDEDNFAVDSETLVKILAVMNGKQPNSTSMLDLRDSAAADLHIAKNATLSALRRTIEFLRSDLHIESSEFVPYETQLIVLAEYFKAAEPIDNNETLKRWFLTTSFNEELRGKPDTYVANILKSITSLKQGNKTALSLRLKLSAEDLLEKRFTRTKALSAAVACLFAESKTRSLVSGKVIPTEEYMREFDSVNFIGLASSKELKKVHMEQPSNKLLANTVLISASEITDLAKKTAEQIIMHARSLENGAEVLSSQFISLDAAEALLKGEVKEFLRLRAASMYAAIHVFCEQI